MTLNQVRRHLVVIINEENMIAAGHLQPGVAGSALSGLVLEDDPQRQVGKFRGQSFLAAPLGCLVHNDDFQRRYRLLPQLLQQRAQIGIAVHRRHKNTDPRPNVFGR